MVTKSLFIMFTKLKRPRKKKIIQKYANDGQRGPAMSECRGNTICMALLGRKEVSRGIRPNPSIDL